MSDANAEAHMGCLRRGLIVGVVLMLVIVVAGTVLTLDSSYSASLLVEQRVYYYSKVSPELAAKLGLGYVSRAVLLSRPVNDSLLGNFEHMKAQNSDILDDNKPKMRRNEEFYSREASNDSRLSLEEVSRVNYNEKDTSTVAEIDKTELRVSGPRLSSSHISHPVNTLNATVQAVQNETDVTVTRAVDYNTDQATSPVITK